MRKKRLGKASASLEWLPRSAEACGERSATEDGEPQRVAHERNRSAAGEMLSGSGGLAHEPRIARHKASRKEPGWLPEVAPVVAGIASGSDQLTPLADAESVMLSADAPAAAEALGTVLIVLTVARTVAPSAREPSVHLRVFALDRFCLRLWVFGGF
eukprot:scaffold149_cov315-Pinguiococcus_pyrenoidosus.AAC.26